VKRNPLSRRQFLTLSASTVAATALAACATVSAPSAPAAQEATAGEVAQVPCGDMSASGELVFSTWGGPKEVQTNETIINLFNEAYPNAQAEVLHIPTNYLDKVLTMFAAGDPPDVLYASEPHIAGYVAKNAILDLTDYFDLCPMLLDDEVYVTRFLREGTMLQDRNFGTVNGTNGYVLFYNKTLFDEAGVGYPTMEWTWDDFVEAAKALTKVEGDRTVQYGTTAGTSYQVLEVLSRSQGGDLFNTRVMPDKSLFDTDAVVWGLEFLQNLIYTHGVAPTPAEASAMPMASPWETGQVAMEIGHSFAIEHRSLIEDWEWDIAHVPMGEQRGGSYSGGVYLVAKASQAPQAAWEFAKWFMMDEPQGVFSLDGLEAPIMRSWRESEEHLKFPGAPEHHSVRGELLEYSVNRGAHHPLFSEIISKVYTPELDKLLLNEQTPDETGVNMTAQADELLAEATSLPL